jgi:hypothetical protein
MFILRFNTKKELTFTKSEDVNATIYTSNFGATVELDQKVYTWTDKVYITIVD